MNILIKDEYSRKSNC